ncbi:preprotein translocase subunit YajC [Enterococcus sp. BWB1-3]|uniref:preprotein translocase subunit YajC n=1 Tax=unclassified Enterococcus TaxID=2608891 RepID=UPI00192475C4|nr:MULTISPECIES: preprotein translocase subunit YajC [unclassified Enterococcus]MBL1228667.1 preprotein translocase subunit YajC [Enterococcus sp. BWB1-3]MCB5952738.1 preprotein translocase subunit YajC [Enterococcus sp. BWT-B8]MCB5953653.1 preprotein translocase subunit YajC [Enterococcus sp. CWB-B31]
MWHSILAVSIIMIAFLVGMALVCYVFNFKNVKRQKDYYRKLHQELAVGQQVIFLNGVHGTLTRIGHETVDVKTKSDAVMEISRFAITEIVG